MSGDGNGSKRFDPGSLTLGVAALLAVLGTVTLTGIVGRVLRNTPDDFVFALVLLLAGATAFAAAGLTLSAGLAQSILASTGLLLTLFGLVLGLAAALSTADDVERPGVSAALAETGVSVKGKATAANLSSDTRLVLLVDGLVAKEGGAGYDPVTLQQSYVGPDGDGKVEFTIDVQVPPGRFDAVGIKSWTSKGDEPDDAVERPCSEYPRRVSTENFRENEEGAGTGCIVLPLPPVPSAPRVSLTWVGEADNAKRVKIGFATDNAPARLYMAEELCGDADDATPRCGQARIAARAQAQLGSRQVVLYRAVLHPNLSGSLDAAVEVPVSENVARVCAEAKFVYESEDESFSEDCALDGNVNGSSAAELDRVGASPRQRRSPARRRG